MPRSPLRGRSFVSVNDLSIDELHLVLETAADVKRRPQRRERDPNVAASLALACAKVGMHFDCASPKGYELPPALLDQCKADAAKTGSVIRQVRDPKDAARGCDAFYGDVWASMGQEKEREKRVRDFKGYQINKELLAIANAEALVLHCLPAHYGEEIAKDVSRIPQSAIWDQAENRLHAQKALL